MEKLTGMIAKASAELDEGDLSSFAKCAAFVVRKIRNEQSVYRDEVQGALISVVESKAFKIGFRQLALGGVASEEVDGVVADLKKICSTMKQMVEEDLGSRDASDAMKFGTLSATMVSTALDWDKPALPTPCWRKPGVAFAEFLIQTRENAAKLRELLIQTGLEIQWMLWEVGAGKGDAAELFQPRLGCGAYGTSGTSKIAGGGEQCGPLALDTTALGVVFGSGPFGSALTHRFAQEGVSQPPSGQEFSLSAKERVELLLKAVMGVAGLQPHWGRICGDLAEDSEDGLFSVLSMKPSAYAEWENRDVALPSSHDLSSFWIHSSPPILEAASNPPPYGVSPLFARVSLLFACAGCRWIEVPTLTSFFERAVFTVKNAMKESTVEKLESPQFAFQLRHALALFHGIVTHFHVNPSDSKKAEKTALLFEIVPLLRSAAEALFSALVRLLLTKTPTEGRTVVQSGGGVFGFEELQALVQSFYKE